jgi:VCBS repeat-containing protein
VLGNDTDVDGDALTASLVIDVSHGILVLNADGSFTYTPADGFVGANFFTYRSNDGATDSDLVTATVTVAEVVPSMTSLDNSEASPDAAVTVVITGTKLSGATKVDFGTGVTV